MIETIAPPSLTNQLMELITTGGPVMTLLGLGSILGVSVFFVKFLQFAQNGICTNRPVNRTIALWRMGKHDQAIEVAHNIKHPARTALLSAMQGTRNCEPENPALREKVQQQAVASLNGCNRYIGILDMIAQLAPLLGLLGTILGMITAFQALQSAGGRADPSMLAGGIWEALLTTAAGLTIAILMIVLHSLLDSRVRALRECMENALTDIFTSPSKIPAHTAASARIQPHAT